MRDGWEVLYLLNPNRDDSDEDPDDDGWDHNGDGIIDPNNAGFDFRLGGELYTNYEEYLGRDFTEPNPPGGLLSEGATFGGDHTDPLDSDTDGDGFVDGREADLVGPDNEITGDDGVLFGGSDPNDPTSTLIQFTGSLTSTNGFNDLRLVISYPTDEYDDVVSDPSLENDGIYMIKDVPTGSYFVYAFEDKTGNGTWDSDDGTGTHEPARTLGGFGNPTSAEFKAVEFITGSPIVILDFDVPSVAFSPSSAPTFAEWAATEGLKGQWSAASIDADGDGVPNLVEFAANTGPLDPSSKPLAKFYIENTLGGLLPAEVPGFRIMTVSHPWNGILAGRVACEIQFSDDLNQGWTTLVPGDGLLHSFSVRGDRIEAKIRCSDVSRTIFTRFIFKETK